jgi:glycosyltransferase involved in cell wall biosynthesis
MIVRNEEHTLSRCLDSVRDIFDEIVIVDTGSTDLTREIASGFTPYVLDFEWVDDFSAARNYALANCSSDYVMWLDADDVLLPEDRIKLVELKGILEDGVDAVTSIYHTDFDQYGNPTASTRRIRLVRRLSNFSWVGAVHEDLVPHQQYRYFDSDIVITHCKTSGTAGPSLRNRRIYEKILAEGTIMRPVDELNYARELAAAKDFASAIPYLEKYIVAEQSDLNMRLFALHKLATCYHMTGQLDMEWKCTLRALELDVPRPEFSCRIGERFLSLDQLEQAIFWYQLAVSDPAGQNERSAVVENHAFSTWLPRKQLALCFFRLGEYSKALENILLAQSYRPNDPDLIANVAMLEELVGKTAVADE